jgi:hypothetical protein
LWLAFSETKENTQTEALELSAFSPRWSLTCGFAFCLFPFAVYSLPMAYSDLREWIAALERAGELKRIKTAVDPVLEVEAPCGREAQPGARSRNPERSEGSKA